MLIHALLLFLGLFLKMSSWMPLKRKINVVMLQRFDKVLQSQTRLSWMNVPQSNSKHARLSLNALFYLTKSALEMVFSLKRAISYIYPLPFHFAPQQIQEQNR